MTVDPRISFWMNVVLTIMIGISAGTVSLSGIADATTAKSIVAYCGLGSFILGAINTALFGMANSTAGRINAAKGSADVRRVVIEPGATGVANDMARDPTEPKVSLPQAPAPTPVSRLAG